MYQKDKFLFFVLQIYKKCVFYIKNTLFIKKHKPMNTTTDRNNM